LVLLPGFSSKKNKKSCPLKLTQMDFLDSPEKRFIARTLLSRQGWERLCGTGQAEFFAPALGAPGGRDHSAGHAKTGAPKPHLSGQPGPAS